MADPRPLLPGAQFSALGMVPPLKILGGCNGGSPASAPGPHCSQSRCRVAGLQLGVRWRPSLPSRSLRSPSWGRGHPGTSWRLFKGSERPFLYGVSSHNGGLSPCWGCDFIGRKCRGKGARLSPLPDPQECRVGRTEQTWEGIRPGGSTQTGTAWGGTPGRREKGSPTPPSPEGG